jgi:hypothetical protein
LQQDHQAGINATEPAMTRPSPMRVLLCSWVPVDFEGHVTVEFFTADYLKKTDMLLNTQSYTGTIQSEEMPDAEKSQIINQLQSLGYMDPGP